MQRVFFAQYGTYQLLSYLNPRLLQYSQNWKRLKLQPEASQQFQFFVVLLEVLYHPVRGGKLHTVANTVEKQLAIPDARRVSHTSQIQLENLKTHVKSGYSSINPAKRFNIQLMTYQYRVHLQSVAIVKQNKNSAFLGVNSTCIQLVTTDFTSEPPHADIDIEMSYQSSRQKKEIRAHGLSILQSLSTYILTGIHS